MCSTDKWFISLFKSLKQPCKVILTTETEAKWWWDFCASDYTTWKWWNWDLKRSLSTPRAVRPDMSQEFNLGDCLGHSRCSRPTDGLHPNFPSNNKFHESALQFITFTLIWTIKRLQRPPLLSYKDIKWNIESYEISYSRDSVFV